MRVALWGVCLFWISAMGHPAEAQEAAAPKGAAVGLPLKVTVGPSPLRCDVATIQELVAEFQDWSKWASLQAHLGSILKNCNIVLSPGTTKPVLVTLVLGDEAHTVVFPQETAHSRTLKGVDIVTVVVVVGNDQALRMKSIDLTLMSSKVDDPLVTQIPDFIKTIVTAQTAPFTIRIPGVNDSKTIGGTPQKLAIYKSSELRLPFKRATIVQSGSTVSGKAGTAANDDKPESNVKATVNVTYANKPDSFIELQFAAGAFVGPVRGHEKMKVDSGKYASDPLGRALTMAAVAIHFAPYGDAEKVTEGQRWAFLAGGVLRRHRALASGSPGAFCPTSP